MERLKTEEQVKPLQRGAARTSRTRGRGRIATRFFMRCSEARGPFEVSER